MPRGVLVFRFGKQRRNVHLVEARAASRLLPKALHLTDRLVHGPVAQFGEVRPDLFRHEHHVRGDFFGLSLVLLGAQLWPLSGDTSRAGVLVARPRHDAPLGDHRDRPKGILISAQQSTDDDVPSRLHPAVGTKLDTVPESVVAERLLGLGETEFPRHTGMFDRGQWRRARPAVRPGNLDDIGERLGHATRNGADTVFRNEFHRHVSVRVDLL